MIKVQFPQGPVVEIESSKPGKGIVIRCAQEPGLAKALANLVDVHTLPDSPDAEVHVANKIVEHQRDAQVIEASAEHYTASKTNQRRKVPVLAAAQK